MKKQPLLMTAGQFAARRGVGPSAVSNWKRDGHVFMAEGPGGKMLIDVARTEAKLNAVIDPSRGRPTTSQMAASTAPVPAPAAQANNSAAGDGGLGEVRTDLIRQQTISKRMDNAARAGELVALEEYQRRAEDNARLARERMGSLLRSNADRLAATTDPREVVAFFGAEIERAFAELADIAEAGEGAADDLVELETVETAEIEAEIDAERETA